MSQEQAIRKNKGGVARRMPLSTLASLLVVAATLVIAGSSPAEADCPDYRWACANGSDITFGTCYQPPFTCSVCNSNWQNECRGKDVRCNDGKITPEARMDGCSAPESVAGSWNEVFRKAC